MHVDSHCSTVKAALREWELGIEQQLQAHVRLASRSFACMPQDHGTLLIQHGCRRCHAVVITLHVLHGRPASSVMRPQGMPPPSSRSSTGQPSVSFCLDACLTDLASGTLACWPNGPLSCGLRHGGIRGNPVTMCKCFRPETSDAISGVLEAVGANARLTHAVLALVPLWLGNSCDLKIKSDQHAGRSSHPSPILWISHCYFLQTADVLKSLLTNFDAVHVCCMVLSWAASWQTVHVLAIAPGAHSLITGLLCMSHNRKHCQACTRHLHQGPNCAPFTAPAPCGNVASLHSQRYGPIQPACEQVSVIPVID